MTGYGVATDQSPRSVDSASSPHQRRASGQPDLWRLRCIAKATLASYGDAPGLTLDDLIHAGWLACAEAITRARTVSYPYARARFAMLDEVRASCWMRTVGTGTRGGAWMRPWVKPLATSEQLDTAHPRLVGVASRAMLDDEREAMAARDPTESPSLSSQQSADLSALFARVLTRTEERVMCGLLIDEDSLALVSEQVGLTESQAAVHRSRACAKVRAWLAAAGVVMMAVSHTARAQSITIAETWRGPVPGASHAPLVHLSLGNLNSADGVHHWAVRAGSVPLSAMAFGKDSAAVSPAPTFVFELARSANARLTGAQFSCKKAGDAPVRVRWVDAAGATIASDTATIRCHP